MPPFLRHRSVSFPLPHLCASVRTLSTFPRALPTYVPRWNPTYHNLLEPSESVPNRVPVFKNIVEQDARKRERKVLRDSQEVAIAERNNNGWTLKQRRVVERLNGLLGQVNSGKGKMDVLSNEVWKAYSLAKRQVPDLLSHIPDRAWDILWDLKPISQSTKSLIESDEPDEPDEPDIRSIELRLDMHAVGKSSTVGMWAGYLEDLFLRGNEEQALQEWEEAHAGYRGASRHDYKPEHLEIGAKLYALAGHADRAREIADELFELYPNWDPAVLLHVLRVHTDTASEKHRTIAKKIYAMMMRLMEKRSFMTPDSLKACLIGFLEAGDMDAAKSVFGDMIKHGFLAASLDLDDISETLRMFHILCSLGTDIDRMTSICLLGIETLPPAYHLHIFGYWMERSVKFNAWEVTARILGTMFAGGYRPTTTHFNLYLRALLRTQYAPNVSKAEDIAWRMVEEAKTGSSGVPLKSTAQSISEHEPVAEPVNGEVFKKVPPANATTFALIMKHHANRAQWEHVDYLARRLEETNTPPNTTLMNVLMDNFTRKGKFVQAWKLYKSLTAPTGLICYNCGESGHMSLECPSKKRPTCYTCGKRGHKSSECFLPKVQEVCSQCGLGGHSSHECNQFSVFPDGASIRCAWKTLRLALGNEETRDDPALPKPRELLAETVDWWKLCRSRHDAEQFRTGLASANKTAITKLAVHCFGYTHDLAGSLVALHVLRQHFHIFPTDDCAQLLQRQAAWIDERRETGPARPRHDLAKSKRETLTKLAKVFRILLERRLEKLGYGRDEKDYAQLSDEELGDLGLNLLSEFIRVIMKRRYGAELAEAVIQHAKDDAGVPSLPTGDMSAFEVA